MSNLLHPQNPYPTSSSNPQQTPVNPMAPSQKIYTKGWIWFGTYMGGPLTAGYLVSKNFETFGQQAYADKAFKIGIVATLILFGALAFIPTAITDKIPNFIIPLSYTTVVASYVAKYQEKTLETHLKNGGAKYSGWKVLGISILCFVISLAYFFALILAVPGSIL